MFITDMSNALKERSQNFNKIPAVSISKQSNCTEEEVFCSLVASTAQYFGADHARLIIQTEGDEMYKVLAQYRTPGTQERLSDVFTGDQAPMSTYLKSVFCAGELNIASFSEYEKGGGDVLTNTESKVVSIPIFWKSNIVGLFEALFTTQAIDEGQLEVLFTIAQLSGSALHEYSRKFETSDLRNMLLLMVNHSKSTILLEDPDDKILLVNRAFCKAIGPVLIPVN